MESSVTNVKVDLLDAAGKKVEVRELPGNVFGCTPNLTLMHQVVRWQRARKRAGTHSVKTRAEVSGGGAKPWKQKGTGRARAGSNTSPLWVRGGTAHGPKVRSYDFSLNKQERKAALSSALSLRTSEGKLRLLKSFNLKDIKTKNAQAVLSAIGVPARKKAVVVVPEGDQINTKSLKNIDGIQVLKPKGLNVYDLLWAEYLVVLDETVPSISERF